MTVKRTDMELVREYLAGDADSFAELYERYRRPLFSYLNKMLPGQSATVDDVYQKTWIKATNNLARYREQNFFSWLVRIGRNNAIDHIRREGKKQFVNIEELSVRDAGNEPWRDMGNGELARAIADAVEMLPIEQREVFALRQQAMSFKDIATLQGCSINTALGRMRYAVLNLRQRLQDWR